MVMFCAGFSAGMCIGVFIWFMFVLLGRERFRNERFICD